MKFSKNMKITLIGSVIILILSLVMSGILLFIVEFLTLTAVSCFLSYQYTKFYYLFIIPILLQIGDVLLFLFGVETFPWILFTIISVLFVLYLIAVFIRFVIHYVNKKKYHQEALYLFSMLLMIGTLAAYSTSLEILGDPLTFGTVSKASFYFPLLFVGLGVLNIVLWLNERFFKDFEDK